MNKPPFTRVASAVGALLIVRGPALARQADPRPVSVAVTVRTEDGTPLSRVPIQVVADHDHKFGFSDLQGALSVTVNVGAAESYLVVALSDGSWFELGPNMRAEARDRFEAVRTQFFFSRANIVPLSPPAIECSTLITAYSAISLTAIVEDGSGSVPFRRFHVRGGSSADDLDASHPFVVPGIRRGAPADIFVTVGLSPQLHVIHLNAAQTAQDVDLGLLELIGAPRTVTASLTMTNSTALSLFDIDGSALWTQVALIRSDAQVILGFRVDQASGAVVERLTAAPPLIMPLLPAGTYYACPGIMGTPLPLALFDAIRDGRLADLDAAGVPKFTAVEGQPVTLQFDARAARDAIMACCPPQNP